MDILAEQIINELNEDIKDFKKTKFAVYRAINLFPNVNKYDVEFVKRHAKLYINKGLSKKIHNEETLLLIETNEKIRKKVVGGSKNFNLSFWDQEDSIELAVNDEYFQDAQPKGNYFITKEFLRNDWKHIEIFSIVNLQKELTNKYPNKNNGSGFSLQRWGDGIYDFHTKKLLAKPLWKRSDHNNFFNIFYYEV